MSLKGVLLDFDGTMADTAADIAASVNYALGKNFGPQFSIDVEQCRRTVGRGLRNELKDSVAYCGLSCSDEKLDAMLVQLEDYYAAHPCDHTYPYDGMIQALAICNQRGLKLGVFSNKADAILRIILDKLFSGIEFDYICGLNPSIPRKPSPEGLYRFMNETGLSKDDFLYVGDSEVDWQTGRNADVRTLIVTWGFRSKEALAALGVHQDAFIETMAQLEDEFRRQD